MTKMMLAATLHQILKLLLLLPLLPVEASNTIIDDIGATEEIVSFSFPFHPFTRCQSRAVSISAGGGKNVLLCQWRRGLPF